MCAHRRGGLQPPLHVGCRPSARRLEPPCTQVGCGKSSLLQLLLGEMRLLCGSVRVRREGGVGYVPQQAWEM